MLPKPRVEHISGRKEWTSEEFLNAVEGQSKRRTEKCPLHLIVTVSVLM